jgi:hypothetical protein
MARLLLLLLLLLSGLGLVLSVPPYFPPASAPPTPRFPTPVRGFNPCNGLQCNMAALGESGLRSLADALVSNGFVASGYTWFSLDDGWAASSRLPNGSLTWNAGAFPSGIPALASYVAQRGLRLGIYTCRGTSTCEGLPGSKGYEVLDAQTFAAWGVRFVKSDSCSASEVHAEALADYRLMGAALRAEEGPAGEPIFFSLCAWWSYTALLGGLGVSDSARIGTDVPNLDRFYQNVEAAASVSNVTGFGRGWPDIDMIGGHWSAVEERLHLSFVAVVGSPLLVSWNVSTNTSSTLGNAPYLNPELLAVHGDALAGRDAAAAKSAGGEGEGSSSPLFYYQRVAGGPVTLPFSSPIITGADCASAEAQFVFHPSAAQPGYGQFESASLPGMCLGIWDLWTGACVDPAAAQLVACNSTAYGCPLTSQMWSPAGAAGNYTLANGMNPWPALRPSQEESVGSGEPFPGPYLTHDTPVPSALFVQPSITGAPGSAGNPLNQSQGWVVTAAAAAAAFGARPSTMTTLRSTLDGTCLASPPAGSGAGASLTQVWARWLDGGDVALLLFNSDPSTPRSVSCDSGCLAFLAEVMGRAAPPTTWRARDVWAQQDAGTIDGASGYVSPVLAEGGGSELLRLTPVG